MLTYQSEATSDSDAMDSQYAMHPPQMAGQAAFYYYNPDPEGQNRQHGHFTPQPTEFQQYNAHYQQQPQFSHHPHSMPMSQPMLQPKAPYSGSLAMTPMASPQPLSSRPTIIVQQDSPALLPLDTSRATSDSYFFPSTPPLSTAGSAISSPPSSCGILPTPVNGVFFPQESFEGVKEGCEGDVQAELLANLDWARSGSPPMTPGKPNSFFEFLSVTFQDTGRWTLADDVTLATPIPITNKF
jgi:hypothetical protein